MSLIRPPWIRGLPAQIMAGVGELSKGVIIEPEMSQDNFVSQTLVEKRDGEQRPMHDEPEDTKSFCEIKVHVRT